MKSGLAILLWATGPEQPHLCATPFVQAAAAAALDVDVEVHFAGKSVALLVPGVAAALCPGAAGSPSVYDRMRIASEYGARFLACSDALDACAIDRARLIAECSGVAGAVAFLDRALDPAWTALVF